MLKPLVLSLFLLVAVCSLQLLGCGDDGRSGSGDADSDSDSDSDTDSDTGIECPDTTWVEHGVSDTFRGAYSVYAADLDGDNDLDVLGAAGSPDHLITWWENATGDGTAWTENVVDDPFEDAHSVYAADLDGDNDLDILGAAVGDNCITWWENAVGDGSSWTEHTVSDTFGNARSVYAADVDGDSDLDIIGAAGWSDAITWWENAAGDGSTWTEHTVSDSFDDAYSVYAADMDGDNDIDLLGAALAGGAIAWWENAAGDGSTWTEHMVSASFAGAFSVHAADVDGDDDLDILGAACDADSITWWENAAGDGSTWTEHTVDDFFDSARAVFAADMDLDGDVDILGAAFMDDSITWWENAAGDGSTWTEHTVNDSVQDACTVFAADMDGDGDLDILGAGRFSYPWLEDDLVVSWWENPCI
jgi:hypothetical protein